MLLVADLFRRGLSGEEFDFLTGVERYIPPILFNEGRWIFSNSANLERLIISDFSHKNTKYSPTVPIPVIN